jgi:hypothetical protein
LRFYANSGDTCVATSASALDTSKCKKLGDGLNDVEDGKSFDVDNIKETTQSVTAITYEWHQGSQS